MAKDISPKTHFRGYAIPGSTVPGGGDSSLEIEEGETLDVLCGHFRIFQLRDVVPDLLVDEFLGSV